MPVDNATEAKLLRHAMAHPNFGFRELLDFDPTILGGNEFNAVRNRWCFIKRIQSHDLGRFYRMVIESDPQLRQVYALPERFVVTIDGFHAPIEVPNNNETGAAFPHNHETGAANEENDRDILVGADGTIHLAASNDETAAANGDEESFVLID